MMVPKSSLVRTECLLAAETAMFSFCHRFAAKCVFYVLHDQKKVFSSTLLRFMCVFVALVAEECVRQLQMRVHSNRVSAATTSSQQDLDRSLKNKREVGHI